jgi:signal transduction histidine kinase
MDTQEVQQRLLGARADELEAFSGRVAHDILNPLNAVGLSLQLLQRGLAPEKVVQRAASSLGRAHRIIDALLSFARSGARPEADARCHVEPVLVGVVSDAEELATSRDVDLVLEVEGELHAACAAGVLTSLVGNLVTNAVKYMGQGSDGRRVTVRAKAGHGTVQIEVEDTGPGLEPGTLRTIFEPYVRGKGHQESGIGLGLATVKKLTEAHGGHIGVESVVGRGSRFWFDLPQAQGGEAAQPAALTH